MDKKIKVRVSSLTDKGLTRDHNEDFLFVSDDLTLVIVCDGVGGIEGGEVASKMAAETFSQFIKNALEKSIQSPIESPIESIEDAIHILENAVAHTSKTVYEFGQTKPELAGMATTFDALWIVGDQIFTVHIGDGSIFQLEKDKVQLLTVEHNYRNYLLNTLHHTPEEIKDTPYLNHLERSMGHEPVVEADIQNYQIDNQDMFLLCTDGITKCVKFPELEKEFLGAAQSPEQLPKKFIDLNNLRGGKDNASVAVVSIQLLDQPGQAESTEQAFSRFEKEDKLKQVDFFKPLERRHLMKLLSIASLKKVPAGEYLAQDTDIPKHFWILLSGEVEIFTKKHEGGQQAVSRVLPGACVGESAIFSKTQRNATLMATEDTQVLEFDGERFNTLAARDTQFGVQVFRSIAANLYDKL